MEVQYIDSVDAELIDCTAEPVSMELPYGSVKNGKLSVYASLNPSSEALKYKTTSWIFHMDDGSETLSEELRASSFLMLVGLSESHSSPVGLILLPVEDEIYRRVGSFTLPKAPTWHPRNPFRYTAQEKSSIGKKRWLCQVGRRHITIV